jgi:hypothetical protein
MTNRVIGPQCFLTPLERAPKAGRIMFADDFIQILVRLSAAFAADAVLGLARRIRVLSFACQSLPLMAGGSASDLATFVQVIAEYVDGVDANRTEQGQDDERVALAVG